MPPVLLLLLAAGGVYLLSRRSAPGTSGSSSGSPATGAPVFVTDTTEPGRTDTTEPGRTSLDVARTDTADSGRLSSVLETVDKGGKLVVESKTCGELADALGTEAFKEGLLKGTSISGNAMSLLNSKPPASEAALTGLVNMLRAESKVSRTLQPQVVALKNCVETEVRRRFPMLPYDETSAPCAVQIAAMVGQTFHGVTGVPSAWAGKDIGKIALSVLREPAVTAPSLTTLASALEAESSSVLIDSSKQPQLIALRVCVEEYAKKKFGALPKASAKPLEVAKPVDYSSLSPSSGLKLKL